MKKSKAIFAILTIAVLTLMVGQPVAQAGSGLPDLVDLWPVESGAKGETFYGTLVIVYTPTTDVPCFLGPKVTMTFHLTLYKNRSNSWFFEGTDEGPYCLVEDVEPEQQVALSSFLDDVVLPGLKGGKFSQIFLKKVDEDFFDTRPTAIGPPDYTVANVEIVAK